MFDINLPIAFVGGMISFFAPCVVPLLPAYIGYVTGVSAQDLARRGESAFAKKIILSSIFYILGFSLIFVILGTAASGLGFLLRQYDFWIQRIGGLFILILGLNFAGFLPIPALAAEKKPSLPSWFEHAGYLRAAALGLVFALAWTPCVGVVLGSILALAAIAGTVVKGATLLFVYSLGISIPFILVSLTLASAPRYLSFIRRHTGIISRFGGLLLAVIGFLLLTDTYKYVNSWIFEIAFKLGYQIR